MRVEETRHSVPEEHELEHEEDQENLDAHLIVPDRQAYVWGWATAAAIVRARYADSAIDALPVIHPENGWDRFLLTRRVTSNEFKDDTANRFGMIMLTGEDAPIITRPSGAELLPLGPLFRDDPKQAMKEAVKLFPTYGLPKDDLGGRWRERKRQYPRLYRAIAELIAEEPEMLAAREVAIDTKPVDGAYHPLYLHGVTKRPIVTYDWFLVQWRDRAAFIRTHSMQSIYETDRGTWSTIRKQLGQEPNVEAIKKRIRAWLRIDGEPDPSVD